MALLTPIRDRLSYPSGYSPGIDPTHPAARKFLRFSGVASGNNFIRLDKSPIKGTVTATTNGLIHGTIGPSLKFTGGSGGIQFGGNSVVAPTSYCAAAIFIDTTAGVNGIIFCITSAAATCPMLWKSPSDNNLHLGSDTGSPEISSGIPITSGVPYFAVASYAVNGSGFINFALTNLLTGQIRTASIANTFAATAPNGTYVVGGDGVADGSNNTIAAAMYSTAGLGPKEVLAFASDPWAFWYPDLQYLDDQIVGATAPTPPGPGPNFLSSLMPMMGVG